jgi:hypothetical protein
MKAQDDDIISVDNAQKYSVLRCKCKDEFTYLDKTYKNKCIVNKTEDQPGIWCETEGECGRYHPETKKYWDFCTTESTYKPFYEIGIKKYGENFYLLNIIGIITFIILSFIIFYMLSKINKSLGLLFLANVDLLATILNYNSGPYYSRMFYFNYSSNDIGGIWSYISKIIINFTALSAVLYIIIYNHPHDTKINKLYIGLICLFFTYFLPNEIIEYCMIEFDTYLYDSKQTIRSGISKNPFSIKNYILVILIGILVASAFLALEHFIIESLRN